VRDDQASPAAGVDDGGTAAAGDTTDRRPQPDEPAARQTVPIEIEVRILAFMRVAAARSVDLETRLQ
jgi:hypothetical protein